MTHRLHQASRTSILYTTHFLVYIFLSYSTLYVDCGLHILMPLEWEQNVHVHVMQYIR